jgi:hypothetical protein
MLLRRICVTSLILRPKHPLKQIVRRRQERLFVRQPNLVIPEYIFPFTCSSRVAISLAAKAVYITVASNLAGATIEIKLKLVPSCIIWNASTIEFIYTCTD